MFSTKGYVILTREDILLKVSEFDIFKYYIPSLIKENLAFCSELRNDLHPSCKVSLLSSGETLYKDFSNGESYNCFEYVKKKFRLTEQECLQVISNDFKLGLINHNEVSLTMGYVGTSLPKPIKKETKADIKIVSVQYTNDGFFYWNDYGISLATLKLFNIKQISHYYINSHLIAIKKGLYAFAYDFGKGFYKILNPFDSEWKWTSNTNPTIIQGYDQLPKEGGELLIITKALKDVMVLREIGYYAIAPQSENTEIPIEIINFLKEKWELIVIYYDNDSPGIEAAKKYSVMYGVRYFHNGVKSQKDASDFSKRHGIFALKKKMKRLLNKLK